MDRHLELDQLVELLDQYSDVYPLSPTGARGWVRAKRHYPQREPEISIEWDKSHWRYHGEPDGWTFEHHFAPATALDIDEHCILTNDGPDENTDVAADYLETLMAGQEAALGADGFFMITLTPRVEGDRTIYQPQVYGEAFDEMTRTMIEAQVLAVAAQLMEGEILNRVKGVQREDDL